MRESKVNAKLRTVVASNLGPVVHELVLVLAFDQRAVATGRVQTVAKIGQRAVKLESRETPSGCITGVQAVQPQSLRGRGGGVWFYRVRIVLEPAEPEVREQCAADCLVKSRRQAVVVNVGTAAQSSNSPS